MKSDNNIEEIIKQSMLETVNMIVERLETIEENILNGEFLKNKIIKNFVFNNLLRSHEALDFVNEYENEYDVSESKYANKMLKECFIKHIVLDKGVEPVIDIEHVYNFTGKLNILDITNRMIDKHYKYCDSGLCNPDNQNHFLEITFVFWDGLTKQISMPYSDNFNTLELKIYEELEK